MKTTKTMPTSAAILLSPVRCRVFYLQAINSQDTRLYQTKSSCSADIYESGIHRKLSLVAPFTKF